MSALDYFLKANLYGLLFAGCYALFLRRHTFLNLNRVYLLLSAVLSLALPLANLPTEAVDAISIPTGVIVLPVSVIATATVEPTGPDWTLLGAWAYGLIAFELLLRLAIQLSRLIRLIRQSERQVRDSYVLVLPHDQTTPTFSFFQYVVLNPTDVHNELILNHELIHVRQYHSADVLGLALLRAVFWPVLALIFVERALRHVHEFLADNQANQQPHYAQFLVEYTFGVRPDVLTNGFFKPSLLKQRILMLHQRATNRWALGKYVLVLPLALGLLAMTTAREEIAAVVEQATDETITVLGKVIDVDGKPLPGTSVMDGKRLIQTDSKGHYQFTDLQSPATLMFSRLGFKPITHKITSTSILNVTLRSSQDTLPAMGATADYKAVKPNPKMPMSTGPDSQTINGEVFTVVEQQPTFPGGIPALMQYVAKNLHYPARAQRASTAGKVLVKFVVTKTGVIRDVRILKGIGFGCDEEAIRVVSQMPKWNPGKQNGKPVAVQYNLPIQFSLEKRQDNGNLKAYLMHMDSISRKTVTIRLRGAGPLGQLGKEPLYIMNDEEINAGIMKTLQPYTIQSIEDMKADWATARYGEKGKNGVVIITMKKP